ncbi:MAG: hypothetical protein EOP61_29175 [Sphingomonadales bacterium]|jgi:hypothetical protein|nr:MAG: hypothetical protein EOP61_29175 [Sphingomonadales bacterium]
MAIEERRTTSGNNGFLYFAVGALIVAVGVLAWMFYNGESNRSRSDTALERVADSVGDAARDIGDSAKDAARNVPTPQPTPAPAAPPATPG